MADSILLKALPISSERELDCAFAEYRTDILHGNAFEAHTLLFREGEKWRLASAAFDEAFDVKDLIDVTRHCENHTWFYKQEVVALRDSDRKLKVCRGFRSETGEQVYLVTKLTLE